MFHVAPRDLVLLLGITLVWGFNVIVSKIGVTEIPPILFTVPALRDRRDRAARPFLRIHRGQMGALAVAAILSGALQFRTELRRACSSPRMSPPSPSRASWACRSPRCCRSRCSARW